MRFLAQGERGLVVELGDAIDPALNARVHALARAVAQDLGPAIDEVVPTYRSLLVLFDPLRASRDEVAGRVRDVAAALPPERAAAGAGRIVRVPVCYGGDLGPDLDDVARHARLAPDEVVRLHASAEYLVYMLGFTPGFPYLGGLPPALAAPRLATPRTAVPAGAVAIGGEQTGIYPVASPGGWRIVGRTPVRVFDPAAERPFLLGPGDRVRFERIERAEFEALAESPSPRPSDDAASFRSRHRLFPPPLATVNVASGPSRGEGEREVLEVIKPGLLTTVQDAGRFGYRAFGMPVAGPMDRYAHAAANLLAGNGPEAAALEMTLAGPTLRFLAPAHAALAGADLRAALDGAPVRPWSAFRVAAGSVLACATAAAGARAYLAVHGGIAVPEVMGSCSTYVRAGVGGLGGRALRAGDRVPVGAAGGPPRRPRALSPSVAPAYGGEVVLRVVLGPQDGRFTARGIAALLGGAYAVTPANDRMGYRLDGAPIEHAAGADVLSDALCPGAVQVPASGQPIVMAVDAQTTGGYAKVATVIGPDLARLAQARQGDRVRFSAVSDAEAVAALREERDALARLAAALAG